MTDKSSQRETLLTYIYEATQDAHHYRPSMDKYKDFTVEQLQAEAEKLSDAVGNEIDRENNEKTEACNRFEADISRMMSEHNLTREEAIERDLPQFNLTREDVEFYGIDFYCYKRGLPTDYLRQEDIFGKKPVGPNF